MDKGIIFIAVLLASHNMLFPIGSKENVQLEIINEKSYFNDFTIIEEKVYIECRITIRNNTEKNISFKINATFEDDVRLGLLQNDLLEGYNEDLINNVFSIPANETIAYWKIIFIGDFAGNYKKHDRALPKKINIVLLE